MSTFRSVTGGRTYRPTESKYKGGAKDMFVTYDLPQTTRAGNIAVYPKIKRVYIAGEVMKVSGGSLRKRSGREVRGVKIEYEQSRSGYRRRPFYEHRNGRAYPVKAGAVPETHERFTQIVEVPDRARNVRFYPNREELPEKYAHALQRVR